MEHNHSHVVEDAPERKLLDHLILPIALAAAVGAAWSVVGALGSDARVLAEAVIVLTLGLAIVVGASMARTRGFATSVAIAAAAVASVFLTEGSLSEDPRDGYVYFLLFAIVMTAVVLVFWFIGMVAAWTWRGRIGKLVRQVLPSRQG